MRLRKLALAVGLASALSAEMASALGLGEIKLLSTLNQPLEAEIKLLQAKDLSENEILIGLASNDDFQRAGIDRLYFLTDLKFSVVLDRPSGPVIRVSSRKPVREPYVNFLLETQWPNGRILREYTLLMDLPVFSDDSVRPVQSARTSTPRSSAAPTRTREPAPVARQDISDSDERASAPRSRAQTQRSQSSRTAQEGADVYGPVGANDTLWEIALKVRPNRGYSVQQTMLAIQRLNPEAFINGNINLLRKGQVLRVPSAGDIDTVTARQAVSEVAQQNNQWSRSASRGEGAQLEGSKRRVSSRTQQQSVSGRLKVAGADAREDLQAGRAAGEVGGDIESLQNDLAISLEELDKSRRDNTELKDRVEELENQIQTMERLLAVSSQELRAMQLGLESNDQAEAEEAQIAKGAAGGSVDEAVVDSESANDELDATGVASEAAMAESDPAAKATSIAQPKKIDPSKVVRSAKPKEPSMMDVVMDNILYIGGALVALIAGAFLLVRRRKQDENDADLGAEEAVFVESTDEDNEIASVFDEAEPEIEAADELEVAEPENELELEDAVSTESQTGDAVGEADIYIAYGKFDQAEDMLLKALDENDQDFAARLKLMEVYVETQEIEKFDQQYASVQASGNNDAMSRAADLREQFDDAPAYIAMSETSETIATEDDDLGQLGESALEESTGESFDFDLGEDDKDSALVTPVSDTDDSELSLDEDFGLNFESSLTDEQSASETADDEFTLDVDEDFSVSDLDEDIGLDLDLDLDLGDDSSTDGDDQEINIDFASEANESADAEAFDLDLDDAVLDSENDLELGLETDVELSTGEDFDLDLSGDSEGAEADSNVAVEAGGTAEEFEGFDLSLEADADATGDSESENFDFSIEGETAPSLDDLDLAADDLDADLASLDAELEADLSMTEASDSLEIDPLDEPLDLSLDEEPGDAFDVDMGDVDLDALDQEVDALSADLDVTDVFVADENEEVTATQSLDEELSTDTLDLAASADESVDFDLPYAELDLDIPTLGADSAEFEIEAESESEVAAEVQIEPELAETETEFDLAADLGLSAEDLEVDTDSSEDEVFTEALSDLPMPEDVMAGDEMTDEDLDAELDFLADTDEAATKLDLARAYIDMGDQDGAKDILDEVVEEGNDEQKQQAQELLTRMS